MNRKSLMSSGLDNESTRNKLKELALYDSETNETDLMKTDISFRYMYLRRIIRLSVMLRNSVTG